MAITRRILGIIIMALGVGVMLAGWAIATNGLWASVANVSTGAMLAFFGVGFVWSGGRLVLGESVRDVLGGVVAALPGHRGVGLDSGVDRRVPSGPRYVLSQILLYVVLAVVVAAISVFSVLRVFRG
jgi:hypothetical protein